MDRNLTSNRNLLSPNKFRIVIDATKFANTEFFCVNAPLPGLSLPDVQVDFRGAVGYVPGDKIDYPEVTFRIMVDEDLENYKEIYNWIHRNHSSGTIEYHDVILQIFSSANRKNKEIKFISGFPTSISSVIFELQKTDIEYISVDVTFRYDRFEIL